MESNDGPEIPDGGDIRHPQPPAYRERESLREQDRKEERICVLIVFGERERERE